MVLYGGAADRWIYVSGIIFISCKHPWKKDVGYLILDIEFRMISYCLFLIIYFLFPFPPQTGCCFPAMAGAPTIPIHFVAGESIRS
jgi:hypothetical protein